MNYLDDINRIKGKALVIVTHDALVASYCKRIIFIKDGRMEKTIENVQNKEENVKKITDIMLHL